MLRRSPAEIFLHQHRHCTVVLQELIYYFARLAGSRRRGRQRAERGGVVRLVLEGYGDVRIVKVYDYINLSDKCFRL